MAVDNPPNNPPTTPAPALVEPGDDHPQSVGLKPHLENTFKVSNDPHFEEELCDIVGLYLNPPENYRVFCVDEKTSIQALDHTQLGP
jgi:hypothetical protein